MKNLMNVIILGALFNLANANVYTKRVVCESQSGQYVECDAGGHIVRAYLEQQLSHPWNSCNYQQSWGVIPQVDHLWVDQGCRGVFVVTVDDGWHAQPFNISCESHNLEESICSTGVLNQKVLLNEQLSGDPCILGETWSWDRNVIKVRNGCQGIFTVYR